MTPRIIVERQGHILLMGLNRPEKRNAADFELLQQLSLAYGELERDPDLRVGLVHAIGDHFTGGLDLADVAPRITADGLDIVPPGGINPWQVGGQQLSKPVVIAVQGTCLTMGLVQQVVADGRQFDVALTLAERIAAQAPLAVQATLANARLAVRDGDAAAEAALQPELVRLVGTEDSVLGMQAFVNRQPAVFVGR
jgi:enoyl-CoA hydratase/carnithine racemase